MARKGSLWGALLIAFAILGSWDLTRGDKDSSAQVGIPPETAADYIHAVIEADRTFYTIHVVERLQNLGKVTASENWRAEGTLPLPAQLLRESGELAALTGARLRYRLTGLWPINKQNGPTTEFEKTGLEEVRKHPERAYTGLITSGSERFFQGRVRGPGRLPVLYWVSQCAPEQSQTRFQAG